MNTNTNTNVAAAIAAKKAEAAQAQAPVSADADALAELALLRAENAKLKAAAATKAGSLSLKVSEKGALSVYGMGRFPVTLYRGQWERLIRSVPEIEAFILANADKLAVKE